MIEWSIYVDKRTRSEKGFSIKIYINNGKERFYVKTGLHTTGDLVNGQFGKHEAEANRKNMMLNAIRMNMTSLCTELGNRRMTREELKTRVTNTIKGRRAKEGEHSLLECIEKYIETKDKPGTRRVYESTLKNIREFDASVTLEDVTVAWLEDLETEMRRWGKSINYIGLQQRNIRAVMNWCIDREMTQNYPFRRFKCKSEETRKRNLKLAELHKLMEYPCEEYQKMYRDLFVLQIRMQGIDIGDLLMLPHPAEGEDEIYFERAKTKKDGRKRGKGVLLKILPQCWEIIHKYEGKDLLLNILEERQSKDQFVKRMNCALQSIGEVTRSGLGGKKEKKPLFPHLSTKWARHTFITFCGELDIPESTMQIAVGHSSGSVTEIYWEKNLRKGGEASKKVNEYIDLPPAPPKGGVNENE